MEIPGPIKKFLENAVGLTAATGIFVIFALALTGDLRTKHILAVSYAVFGQWVFIEMIKAQDWISKIFLFTLLFLPLPLVLYLATITP